MSHRQELSTSPSYCCCCEPEFDPAVANNREPIRCSGLAEHALHPGAVDARLGSKQRPRAARAEAPRIRRWWPWLDSNGVFLFVQQYDRGTCCELLLAINTSISQLTSFHFIKYTWYVWAPYNAKEVKCLFLYRAAHNILH